MLVGIMYCKSLSSFWFVGCIFNIALAFVDSIGIPPIQERVWGAYWSQVDLSILSTWSQLEAEEVGWVFGQLWYPYVIPSKQGECCGKYAQPEDQD